MPTPPELKLPKIAIIGMEGSGKTVLATVLAKRMSQLPDRSVYLDPCDMATMKYVEKIWHTLKNGEWPASTPPGKLFELAWIFCVRDKRYELRLADAAGQDMRLLFGRDETELNNPKMPAELKNLVAYCQEASVLLITLNISDFVGESDTERLIENVAAIKSALDSLSQGNQNVAFIFTQCDQYRAMIDEVGGLETFCKKNLSYIYNAHIHGKKNAIFGVAAVNDVVTQNINGVTRRVPAANFSSKGLNEVISWVCEQVEIEVKRIREEEAKRIEEERRKNQQPVESYLSGWENAFNFTGKSTPFEFWVFMLVNIGVLLCSAATVPTIFVLCVIVVFIPSLSITVRRLLDAGRYSYWALFPIACYAILFFSVPNMSINSYYDSLAWLSPFATFFSITAYPLFFIYIGRLPSKSAAECEADGEKFIEKILMLCIGLFYGTMLLFSIWTALS